MKSKTEAITAYFNPRPPRGERPACIATQVVNGISILAPREGSDQERRMFLKYQIISILAPREGSDLVSAQNRQRLYYFNPRPPRGERRSFTISQQAPCIFQSSPPARGATRNIRKPHRMGRISILAPREGSDPADKKAEGIAVIFQSSPPARGATKARGRRNGTRCISILAPREGSDGMPW